MTDQTPIAPTSDARSREEMAENAATAAAYLKTLAHEGRLMILCHLGDGEKSVGELEELLNMRQAAVSQMLARLRDDIREGLAASVPFPKRLGLPEDYAGMALTLLQNAYVNGETIRLDGSIRMAPR